MDDKTATLYAKRESENSKTLFYKDCNLYSLKPEIQPDKHKQERERVTDRQTDRDSGRQTDRHTEFVIFGNDHHLFHDI